MYRWKVVYLTLEYNLWRILKREKRFKPYNAFVYVYVNLISRPLNHYLTVNNGKTCGKVHLCDETIV